MHMLRASIAVAILALSPILAHAQGVVPTIPVKPTYTPDGGTTFLPYGPPLGSSFTSPLSAVIGTASGAVGPNNPLPTVRPDSMIPFSATATGLLGGAAIDKNAYGYAQATITISAAGTGNTVTFNEYDDSGSPFNITCIRSDGLTTTSVGYTGTFYCPLSKRYFAPSVTTYGSGSIVGTINLTTAPTPKLGAIGLAAATVGGWPSSYNMVNLASTNTALISSGSHNVGHIACTNTDTVAATVRLFDKASAPTLGTDNPVYQRTILPSASISDHFADVGKYFNNGLGFAMTAGIALLDNTAMATAAKVQCTMAYK